jgi:hypothetical protein
MINVTKETTDAPPPNKTFQEIILEEIIEKFMEKIQDVVNQNVQESLKKFQDTNNKEHEKTQK